VCVIQMRGDAADDDEHKRVGVVSRWSCRIPWSSDHMRGEVAADKNDDEDENDLIENDLKPLLIRTEAYVTTYSSVPTCIGLRSVGSSQYNNSHTIFSLRGQVKSFDYREKFYA